MTTLSKLLSLDTTFFVPTVAQDFHLIHIPSRSFFTKILHTTVWGRYRRIFFIPETPMSLK